MMKPTLLFLSSRAPFPLHGGDAIRAYHLMRELSEVFQIHLLALIEGGEDQAELQRGLLLPAGPCTHVEFHCVPRRQSIAGAIKALLVGEPIQVGYYRSAAVKDRVKALSGKVDAVASHLVRMAPYAELLDVPRLLEYTDALSLFYDRVAARKDTALSLKTIVYRLEQPRILRYELDLAARFDVLSFAGEIDRSWLAQRDPHVLRKGMTASNGVQLVPWHGPTAALRPDLIFLGNMRTLQNQDAMDWFIEHVMPPLLDRLPQARLRIVGHCPEDVRERLGSGPNVEVLGVVDDLRSLLGDALTGICPMRLGAGIQNKVLDYMNHGLPVVSSELGTAGLGAGAKQGLTHLHADSPAEWVDAICRLWAEPELRRSLASEGRQLVERGFSWSANLAPVVQALVSALRDHGGRTNT